MARQRLEFVDALRAVAALAVLVQHTVEKVDYAAAGMVTELAPGVFGVVLFFFISGFIIPFSVRGEPALLDFAVRRMFRIFPAYLFIFVVIAALVAAGAAPWSTSLAGLPAWGWLANLVLVQDYVRVAPVLGVSWTLSIEFVWYGVFIVAVLLAGERRIALLSIGYSALMAVLAAVALATEQRLPMGRIGLLNAALLGYVGYLWFVEKLSERLLWCCAAAFAVSSAAAFGVVFGVFHHPTISLFHVTVGWGGAFVVFMTVLRVAAIRTSRLLCAAPMVFCGRISYSLYLVHSVVISALLGVVGQPALLILVPLGAGLSAWAMYGAVERTGIAAGRIVAARLAGTGHRQAAAA